MADVCEKHGVKLLTYGTLVSARVCAALGNTHPFVVWGIPIRSMA